MDQDKNTTPDAEEDIQLMKKDVGRPKPNVEGQKTPWYKNAPTLISLLALLLSFGTTYFSYTRAETQNIQNTRTELRGLLQRLSSLPREYQESINKYHGDRNLEGAVSSTIAQENSLLSGQAAELARKLPRNYVSATEWYSIATALQMDLKFDEAKELLGYALESAKGLTEKIAVLRGTASLLFTMGKAPDGRVEYQKALSIFSEFDGYDDRTKSETHIQTHLSWAYSAAYLGLYEEVNEQLTRAEGYLPKLLPSQRTEAWSAMVNQARQELTAKKKPTKQSTDVGTELRMRREAKGPPPQRGPKQRATKAENKPRQTSRKRRR